ncbi:MAG: flagellar brake protein [Clostridiales bacterium]|nr:flagellar brake protein [Eubacteriales bacterium]MDH7565020.1 flagellar brake protein [Clostridiales bacterium]
MKLADLAIGTKMELELYDSLGEKIRPPLISEFEWAEGESTAFIAAPIHEGNIYPVRIGTVMDICFLTKGDLMTFKARVLDRDQKDNIALLKIEAVSEFEKIQRRQFFRFEWSIPVQYRIVSSYHSEQNGDEPFINAVTKDLSGGGLCIVSKDKIELDKILECQLTLGSDETIKFFGKVIRVVRREDKGNCKYEVGVAFRKIDQKDRESVIKHIFEEQRKLRKKGLI